jgi:hypothetical protein
VARVAKDAGTVRPVMVRSVVGGIAAAAALIAAAPAAAQSPPEAFGPYDGSIPFACTLQYVGTGTDFPDPDADPFCVEYDKTNQNVTDFGLAEFTAQEPARVAAASPKCFYFQRDHWTGSIQQGSEPELWHWDGDYFFDKARGVGGVSVRNFRLGGVPMDASPYVPEAYRPYFDEGGGGGVLVELESDPDPNCAARVDTPAEQAQVYGGALAPACVPPGGELRGRRVGRARLGMRRAKALSKLGAPERYERRIDRWCLVGKGELRVAYSRRGRARVILSSGRGHAIRGVARGDRARRAHRRLGIERRSSFKRRGMRAFEVAVGGPRRAWVGIRAGRVRWVLISARGVSTRRLVRTTTEVR